MTWHLVLIMALIALPLVLVLGPRRTVLRPAGLKLLFPLLNPLMLNPLKVPLTPAVMVPNELLTLSRL